MTNILGNDLMVLGLEPKQKDYLTYLDEDEAQNGWNLHVNERGKYAKLARSGNG